MAFSESAGTQDHGEGENYFVSMTDMMVGMLFVFIILLMSFALLFRQQTDVTNETRTSKIRHANEIEQKLENLEKKSPSRSTRSARQRCSGKNCSKRSMRSFVARI